MLTEPKIGRRKKQYYVAIRMAVPIPFGKYLQPAWDEVYGWLKNKEIKPSGPAIIRYLTTDMSKELQTLSPLGAMPHFCILDPTKARASSKQLSRFWIGQRKVRSSGIPQRKKVSSGGAGVPNFIFLTPKQRKIRRSSRPNSRFWSNDMSF